MVSRDPLGACDYVCASRLQGHVYICGCAGPTAVGGSFKTRSSELLHPLQMHVLDAAMKVVPVKASFDVPATASTHQAEMASAAAALQEQMGPFVDVLSDGKQKSFMGLLNRASPACIPPCTFVVTL